jgi:TP901 family phage tail tape measure protein
MSKQGIKAGSAYVEIGIRNRIAAGAKGIQHDLDKMGRKITAMGGIVSGLGITLGAPFAFAAGKLASFDDAMRATGAVSKATSEELASMSNVAKELGRTTSFTAVEVGMLMTELGRAGFAPQQIENMTGAVLDLARATGTDAVLASGIMAATIRQFGLAATDASRVADVLTAAANGSFNTVEQLGEALSYAGPVAADFNMSIEETAAILGTLGNVGIQASNAGTVVRRLLTITGAEAERLRQVFGVSFIDINGNARPLIDTLGEVATATNGLGTAARSAKFNEAFGLLGITGASAIGKVTVETKALYESLLSAQGQASKTAREMDGGLGGSFRKIASAAEGAVIAIGESFGTSLKEITDALTMSIGGMTAFIEKNKSLVASLAMSSIALTGAGFAMIGMGVSMQFASASVGASIFWAGALSAAWTTAAGVVAAAWTTMLLPLAPLGIVGGLALAAVTALAGAAAIAAIRAIDFGRGLKNIKDTLFGMAEAARLAGGVLLTAIAAGNYEMATKATWLGVKIVFLRAFDGIVDGFHWMWGEAWKATKTFFTEFVGLGIRTTVAVTDAMRTPMLSGAILAKTLADIAGSGLKFSVSTDSTMQQAAAAKELYAIQQALLKQQEEAAAAGGKPGGASGPRSPRDPVAAAEAEAAANEAATQAYTDKIKEIELEILALEKGEEAAENARLAQDGLTETQIKAIGVLRDKRKALEDLKKAQDKAMEKRTDNIFERADEMGRKGASPGEIMKRAMMQINTDEKSGVLSKDAAANAREQANDDMESRIRDLKRQGQSLADSLRTPFEVLQDEIRGIQRLRGVGAIDDATLRKAIEKARADFAAAEAKGKGIDASLAEAKAVGPTGSFSAVGAGIIGMGAKGKDPQLERIAKNGERGNRLLQRGLVPKFQ